MAPLRQLSEPGPRIKARWLERVGSLAVREDPVVIAAAKVIRDYETWLRRLMLAPRTKVAYRRWVRELVDELAGVGGLESFVRADGAMIGAR